MPLILVGCWMSCYLLSSGIIFDVPIPGAFPGSPISLSISSFSRLFKGYSHVFFLCSPHQRWSPLSWLLITLALAPYMEVCWWEWVGGGSLGCRRVCMLHGLWLVGDRFEGRQVQGLSRGMTGDRLTFRWISSWGISSWWISALDVLPSFFSYLSSLEYQG